MSIKYVKKRDGQQVPFNSEKIKNAVLKAADAVDMKNEVMGEEITQEVISYLNIFYKDDNNGIPDVEQIQDLVEKVLIEKGYAEVAKAYILYREQHSKLRDARKLFNDAIDSMNDYLNLDDWKVNENSNMGYSLQGLNNFIASEVTAQYWLQEIYPEEIREKHMSGDFHIHDLGNLSVYCCGWDLQQFLLTGFKGVSTKIESTPPVHLKSALGQIVNFFFTLQGEAAGAMAFSNFDTYLAPFIAYDNLDYEEVKQAMQEFLFNMNVPTRVGFQCLSEDTEILTPAGWKQYDEVEKGDTIKTFNVEKGIIENKTVNKIFRRHYKGEMYNLKNRIQDQLISPGHRVVRRVFNADVYKLEEVEDVESLKSPPIIPIAADNNNEKIDLTDEEIKLVAWIIAEGSLEIKGNWRRITIYQSQKKSRESYEEILALLKILDIDYTVQEGTKSLGETVTQIRFNAENSRKILQWFDKDDEIKQIPGQMLEMSQEQSRIFLETYLKSDSHEQCKITTSHREILEGLQQVIVNAGYGFTVWQREATGVGNKLLYILRIIRHKDTYIQEINKVDYEGVIWSVNTDNETVIAKRKEKVFITGNTPFTNLTMDLTVPDFLAEEPVIIGGELQDRVYGEFQEEMDILNRVFAELMIAGDAKGRMFSFPIPTYNITSDFDWDNPVLDPLWEMTAKFGIPYFSNFINSDMNPEDARSMCCRLRIDNTELRKRGGGLFGANPMTGCYDERTEILTEDGWKYFKDLTLEDKLYTLSEDNQIKLYYPKRLFEYDWVGELYRFKSRSLDLLVTPNHRMVYDDANTGERGFVQAKNFNGNVHRIPKQGHWQGEEEKYHILPSIENSWICGNYNSNRSYVKEELKIPMDLWLKFFGIWIAEGSLDNENIASSHGYRVNITQNGENKKKIKEMLETLPFNFQYDSGNFIICNKQLWSYLRQFGDCYSKYIPKKIKTLSKRQLKILFDWLVLGDGHIRPLRRNRKIPQISYYTASKKLAEDIQEIVVKIGYIASVFKRNRGKMVFGERTINTGTQYTVGIQRSKHYRLREKNISKEYYKGKVYCCEVKNNTVLVRRNGKVTWCGNSVGVVTLNMPRIGYLADNEKDFMNRVYQLMDLAKESMEIKRRVLESLTEQGLYPYARFYLSSVKERFDEYWKNHFNTIGLNGMNEALINFMGKDMASSEGREFAVKVMQLMKERMIQYQEETGNLYNLEATPAEGTAYRLARLDKQRFGNRIIAANEDRVKNSGAEPYYTNSTHLPVGYTDDIFTALELQDELQQQYTGGTVFHGFLGENMPGIKSTKLLVKRIAENFSLPYYTITPTFSICPVHGYIPGEHEYCPKCKTEVEAEAAVTSEESQG